MPTDIGVGLTSVSLGIVSLIKKIGLNIYIFKPIVKSCFCNKDKQIEILSYNSSVHIIKPLKMNYVEYLLANDQKNILMEEILMRYHNNTKNAEIIIIEGLIPANKYKFSKSLNYDVAKTLGADIVFVTAFGNNTLKQLKELRIELARAEFCGVKNENITGVIINKVNAPINEYKRTSSDLSGIFYQSTKRKISKIDIKILSDNSPIPIFGCIPWNFDLIVTRAIDIANHLNATIINNGTLQTRRIKSIIFCENRIHNIVDMFRADSLLVISSDRYDIIVSACLAVMNGIEIGALLLTGGCTIAKSIYNLCHCAFKTGLPVLLVDINMCQVSLSLQSFNIEVDTDDAEQIKKTQNHISLHINQKWINSLTVNSGRQKIISPAAFRYKLTELARKANKRIVLPEGNDSRTIKAAAICAKKGIARCTLLGDPDEIKFIAAEQGVELGEGIEIVAPKLIRKNYVSRLVKLRKNKGMTEVLALEQLKDNVVLGTMMLEKNEADGLVSGAIHTTANTIRPALQLIKAAPGSLIVSSIFFMLLPDQVIVYGDCAINPNPTAKQLSEIAIQSADSAKSFGIEPRIAMISYSTGNSGSGTDVDKVREATNLVQTKRPDLVIDGPLQYDAAIMADVAKYKAPNSPVAGKATVFIFPDLNTGNTTYKAVQRSSNLVSIGPMLQGMRKPVNDLSRGALVDDIIYTIALTAIQAVETKNNQFY